MGLKLLILEACLIAGESIGKPAAAGETVDVVKEDAHYLVRSGRAMYTERSDDPTKGLFTASSDDVRRAKERAKAVAAAAEASAAANTPPNLAELLAQAVTAGMVQAMQQMQTSAPPRAPTP